MNFKSPAPDSIVFIIDQNYMFNFYKQRGTPLQVKFNIPSDHTGTFQRSKFIEGDEVNLTNTNRVNSTNRSRF